MLWRNQVEDVLSKGCDTESGLKSVLENVERLLGILANCVLQEQPTLCRKKIENLVKIKTVSQLFQAAQKKNQDPYLNVPFNACLCLLNFAFMQS